MLDIADLRTPIVAAHRVSALPGDCVGLSGPSGAGKSVFLRAVVDLDPNSGTVRLDGIDRASVPAPEWRRRVGYVPAESGWWADIAADHFVGPGIGDQLEAVRLPQAILQRPVAHLSTGERQRLALLRALELGPRALLLDEPTASLDGDATGAVESLLADHLRAGNMIILVSHDPTQLSRLATRHCRVKNGTVSEVEAP